MCFSPTSGSDVSPGGKQSTEVFADGRSCRPVLRARSYMRASFQFDALHRWTEPLHYQMLRMLDRRLHRMPFQSGQRRMEEPECGMELAASANVDPHSSHVCRGEFRRAVPVNQSPYHQVAWLEAHLPLVRQVCLDQAKRRLMGSAGSRAA